MHSRRSAQEVLLCDICETAPLQSHCELCHINLCVNCAVKHISDSSKRHNVVHYLQRESTPNYPKCTKHTEKHCELYCEKCDIPVCITCVSSGKHEGHKLSDILEKLSAKTQSLQKDLKELETKISPRYKEMASNIRTEKAELETKYGKLSKDVDHHGEILHREVTAIVNRRKSDIQEMKNKHLSTLNKNTEEIAQKITELNQIISDLKAILKSKDVSLISTYKPRNSEFRTLPPKVRVKLPNYSPKKINKDQLNEMLGSLSSLSINTEHGEAIKSPEAISSPPVESLLDDPGLTATTDNGVTTGMTIKAEELEKEEVNSCSEFSIKAGKSYALPVVIDKQNTVLCWEFTSHPKDVKFSVTYKEFEISDPATTQCLVPACKYDSHKQAVRGELTANQTGIYTLLFDNTYSRITAKQVCYSLWTRHIGD